MNIFFIRHCEAASNTAHILAGQLEFPLTPEGKMHANNIAQKFKEQFPAPCAIYVSPQLRTRETAQPLCDIFGLKAIEIDELKEQDWGKFSGKTYQELRTLTDFHHPKDRDWSFHPENGESYHDVCVRINRFFSALCDPGESENIICVTHGGTLRIIRGILEQTVPEYSPDVPANGEVWYVPHCIPGKKSHRIEIKKLGGEVLHAM